MAYLVCLRTQKLRPLTPHMEECPECGSPKNTSLHTNTDERGAQYIRDLATITLDDLANNPLIPEIQHMAPIYLRFREDLVYNGQLVVEIDPLDPSHTTCKINWLWGEATESGGLRVGLFQFVRPSQWTRTLEELTGLDATFRGFWCQTRVYYEGHYVDLQTLKKKHYRIKHSL